MFAESIFCYKWFYFDKGLPGIAGIFQTKLKISNISINICIGVLSSDGYIWHVMGMWCI